MTLYTACINQAAQKYVDETLETATFQTNEMV